MSVAHVLLGHLHFLDNKGQNDRKANNYSSQYLLHFQVMQALLEAYEDIVRIIEERQERGQT